MSPSHHGPCAYGAPALCVVHGEFPLVHTTFANSCGRLSAWSIPSLLSRSTFKVLPITMSASGFTSSPHARSLHCSRAHPGTQRPTCPTGTDRTARLRSFQFYSSMASASVSYPTSPSSARSPRRIRTLASSPSRFCPFLCTSPRPP